ALELDTDAAGAAVDTVGEPLGLERLEAALGIVAVADAAMANAIREITVAHGIDPRGFSLLAFGGAGPLHAVALAEELEIPSVVVPAQPGVLSAWGMLHTETRHDLVQSFFVPEHELSAERLDEALDGLRRRALDLLAADGVAREDAELVPAADVRYAGQEYAVTVSWAAGEASGSVIATLPERFATAHLERYGHSNPGETIECVNLRITALARSGEARRTSLPARDGSAAAAADTHRSYFDGAWHEAAVVRRESLAAGDAVEGPAIVLEDACTTTIPPAWVAQVSHHGHLVLTRRER
ncbi:MAG: hydantoinase/oxoprolinase family protein, partial [Actinobacteria bacterium]|nr:hydantoinase/oxoprolinase family protein [Actinomycetota bacterium]